MAYMNNILIHLIMYEESVHCTKLVLQQLSKHNLFLKLQKCKFDVEEVKYLGMIISHNKVQMDQTKLETVQMSRWAEISDSNIQQLGTVFRRSESNIQVRRHELACFRHDGDGAERVPCTFKPYESIQMLVTQYERPNTDTL